MADGFKKYFNGTTISGRANVAKATYATLALLYIIYRMRRGGSSKESQLASDTCSCDAEADPMPHGDTGIYGADPDCSVCRDRSERAMSEYDREQRRKAAAEDNGCRDDPPPPPPSASSAAAGSAAKPRAKCPCEDSQKRVNGALKNNNNNSSSSHARAWSHQLQPPNQYRQHFQQHGAAAPTEQESPVSELMGQVYDAVSRVVRGVVGAVLGGVAVNTTSGGSSAGEAQSFYEQDEDEDEEEDEVEEWREDQAYGSRNNPLFCTPTSHSNGTPRPTDEGARVNYNAFSDGFASDMFFTSDAD